MAIVKPFKGIRPKAELVDQIASRPYDVLNSAEARVEAEGNPHSFLHVVKPEIDLPEDVSLYSEEVYAKGLENYRKQIESGDFVEDSERCFYIYRLTMNGRSQTGLVGCAYIDDYFNNVIKKHELTRHDKENDRMNHIRYTNINAEPVFFAYPQVDELNGIIDGICVEDATYEFESDDGVHHSFWVVKDGATNSRIEEIFQGVDSTYVADGHHRTAAAALVGKERREENQNHNGDEEYNYFLAVHFPSEQLQIFDYNRVVKDLNGLSDDEFIESLSKSFSVQKADSAYKPGETHKFGMYLSGQWYELSANEGTYDDADPIKCLDVDVLSEHVLTPILGIEDLRKDKRIDFVGGIRGLEELERRVDSGEMKVAFALYAVTMNQLMKIADSGEIMPPKSTWFEPKLRSGLVVHSLI